MVPIDRYFEDIDDIIKEGKSVMGFEEFSYALQVRLQKNIDKFVKSARETIEELYLYASEEDIKIFLKNCVISFSEFGIDAKNADSMYRELRRERLKDLESLSIDSTLGSISHLDPENLL